VITVRSLSILLTESRLIVFLFNLVSLSLTVLVLQGYTISTDIVALLLVAMLPYYVGSTLIPILYIGKRLNLTDEDFRIVFLSWFARPFACCRSAAMCMWERSEVGPMVARLWGSTRRPPRVSPLIPEGTLSEEEEEGGEEGEVGDSEDDISMASDDIAALIDGVSIDSDRNDEEEDDGNMEDDNAIDIVIED
jgi:hypothetical protein